MPKKADAVARAAFGVAHISQGEVPPSGFDNDDSQLLKPVLSEMVSQQEPEVVVPAEFNVSSSSSIDRAAPSRGHEQRPQQNSDRQCNHNCRVYFIIWNQHDQENDED